MVRSARFDEQWTKGRSAYGEKRYRDAVMHFSTGIESVSTDTDEDELYLLYSNRCAALQQIGEWRKALEDAETVTALKPGFAKGWIRLAKCLRMQGRRNEAEAAQAKAHELDPKQYRATAETDTPIPQWLQNLDFNAILQRIDQKTIIVCLLLLFALYSIFFKRRSAPYSYAGGYRNPYHSSPSYGSPSGGGLGMTGIGIIMLAAWKLPPYFGHQPFFGMSPFTLLWLVQSFMGGGRPRPGFGTGGLFGGRGRNRYYGGRRFF